MKKTWLGIAAALAFSFSSAPQALASGYSPNSFWLYATTDNRSYTQYWEANDWLAYNTRAALERGSQTPTWHTDPGTNLTWGCNWVYRKEQGGWFCEKVYRFPPTYLNASYPVFECSYGTRKSEDTRYCVPVRVPFHGHLTARGDAWECDTGYVPNANRTDCVSLNVSPTLPAAETTYYAVLNRYYAYCLRYYVLAPQINCQWLKTPWLSVSHPLPQGPVVQPKPLPVPRPIPTPPLPSTGPSYPQTPEPQKSDWGNIRYRGNSSSSVFRPLGFVRY